MPLQVTENKAAKGYKDVPKKHNKQTITANFMFRYCEKQAENSVRCSEGPCTTALFLVQIPYSFFRFPGFSGKQECHQLIFKAFIFNFYKLMGKMVE